MMILSGSTVCLHCRLPSPFVVSEKNILSFMTLINLQEMTTSPPSLGHSLLPCNDRNMKVILSLYTLCVKIQLSTMVRSQWEVYEIL